jgi:hypothetical protein
MTEPERHGRLSGYSSVVTKFALFVSANQPFADQTETLPQCRPQHEDQRLEVHDLELLDGHKGPPATRQEEDDWVADD